MTFQEILKLLAQFNLVAWLLAAIASYIVARATGNRGWSLIALGSLFVVMRQVWKFLPGYKEGQASDMLFNAYMNRYVFGAIGAIILCAGFIKLINNYFVLKTKLEERR